MFAGLLISPGLSQVCVDPRVREQFFIKSSASSWILLSPAGGISVAASHGVFPHTGNNNLPMFFSL